MQSPFFVTKTLKKTTRNQERTFERHDNSPNKPPFIMFLTFADESLPLTIDKSYDDLFTDCPFATSALVNKDMPVHLMTSHERWSQPLIRDVVEFADWLSYAQSQSLSLEALLEHFEYVAWMVTLDHEVGADFYATQACERGEPCIPEFTGDATARQLTARQRRRRHNQGDYTVFIRRMQPVRDIIEGPSKALPLIEIDDFEAMLNTLLLGGVESRC
jgi:hypothetical protein